MDYNIQFQTNLIPKKLFDKFEENSSIGIDANGIVLSSDLSTFPIKTIISQEGISTDNINGFNR